MRGHLLGRRGAARGIIALFVANQRRIHAFIRSLIPNAADADDVLQETSITGLAKVGEGKLRLPVSSEEFVTWICTVARFECLRFCRNNKGKRLVFSEELTEQLAGRQIEQAQYLELRQSALRGCLQKLSAHDLTLVQNRYALNLSGKDIAERLGRPINTVYKALQRIRLQLSECIERTVRAENRS